MSTTKSKAKQKTLPKDVKKALDAIAKGIGVAATELWTIFVRQYFVRGLTELFTAIVLCVASYFLAPIIGLWVLIPLTVALGFSYAAILMMGNPKYYALEDITARVSRFRNESEASKAPQITTGNKYYDRY